MFRNKETCTQASFAYIFLHASTMFSLASTLSRTFFTFDSSQAITFTSFHSEKLRPTKRWQRRPRPSGVLEENTSHFKAGWWNSKLRQKAKHWCDFSSMRNRAGDSWKICLCDAINAFTFWQLLSKITRKVRISNYSPHGSWKTNPSANIFNRNSISRNASSVLQHASKAYVRKIERLK